MGLIQFGVIGLGTGGILGLLAIGIVVIFRGAGVVNIAHGGYAMLGAYLYWELEQHGWPAGLGLITAVLGIAILGLATDQLLVRRLRSASPLARFIATVGVLLVVQSSTALIWGVSPQTVPPLIPTGSVRFGGVGIATDMLWLFLIAAVLTAAVAAAWRFTRLGWVAEAVSDHERLAASLGWSTELVSAITWAFGAALAGLAGILIAPVTQLDTGTLPLLVIPALAAALVGGFRSIPLAFAGAVLIGLAQSETARYVHVAGVSDVIPFVVIIAMLVTRGSSLPLRGNIADRLPRVGTGVVRLAFVLPVLLAMFVLLQVVSSTEWLTVLAATFGAAIILLSFVVVVGYTGQVSFAQYTLAGFGALAAGRLVQDTGTPFAAALVLGGLAAGAIGSLIALPALRTRGVSLSVITLALASMAQSFIFGNSWFAGDYQGISVPSVSLLGWQMDPITQPRRYALFALVLLAILSVGVARLRKTQGGRMLLAIRDNERAAASDGINVQTGKVVAFGLAGAIAGVGGIVLAFQSSVLTFGTYDPLTGLSYLAQAVIGGIGFASGPLFGSTLSNSSVGSIVALHLQSFNQYIPLIAGVGLLLTLISSPDGWVPAVTRAVGKRIPWLRSQTAVLIAPSGAHSADGADGVQRSAPVTLSVKGLSVRYGGTLAVDDLSLQIRPGEVLGLIGPNGAGKTSAMDAICGFASTTAGRVYLNDVDVSRWPAFRRARAGIGRSFQALELYPDMTVLENVLSGAESHRLWDIPAEIVRRRPKPVPVAVLSVLAEFGLAEVANDLPDSLSYGKRRLLGIARAVASGTSVLLVDEPVAGLDEAESAEFAAVIRRLATTRRMSVLVVEHDMTFVMSVCDRLVVLDFGKTVTEGTPERVRDDPRAIAAYLGVDEPANGTEGDEPANGEKFAAAAGSGASAVSLSRDG